MVEDRPVAAFTLSLIGLVLQFLGGAFFFAVMLYGWGSSSWSPGMMGPWMMWGTWSAGFFWSTISAALVAVVIFLGVLGTLWMNTPDPDKIRTGSTLVLVASVIAFPTMFGFMLGSLLMLIGGILGLTWQPLRLPGPIGEGQARQKMS